MPYALGVDLGTTYTAAAARHQDGRTEMVPLTPHRPAVPTVVALDQDDRWVVGEAADRRARSDPDRVAREFKRNLGDPTPAVLGSTAVPVEHLLAVVLNDVVGIATRTLGEPPTHVTVTYPASWADHKRALLAAAAATAGVDAARLTFLPEPVAAAVHSASTDRVTPGTAIAVYDLGGGTFDAAVVQRTDTGFELLGHPDGIERAGGLDIDQAVFDHVTEALGDEIAGLDTDDPATTGAFAALRTECTQAKEALSTDSDTTVNVALPGIHRSVRITRAELERRIEPMLVATVTALGRAIDSTGLPAGRIDRILLVGGSSRVPLVAQLVSARFGRPVVIDAHPKHAIALGAAAAAAERAFPNPNPNPIPTAVAAPADPATAPPDPSPTAALAAAPKPKRKRWRVVAGIGVALLVVAAITAVLLDDDGRANGGEALDVEVPQVTQPLTSGSGNPQFDFPGRPIEDEDAVPMAGLRAFDKFAGVDQGFLGRVRQIDPSIANVGIVAETYDAVVSLELAVAASGQDGTVAAEYLPDATRFGTSCDRPDQCLAFIAAGTDVDYDGATGRIELSDGGERTVSRWAVSEVNRTGNLTPIPVEETDAGALFDVGVSGRSVEDTHPSDGTLRIGALVSDPRGTLLPRIDAAAQLAVADSTLLEVPVELLPAIDLGILSEDAVAAAEQLVAAGVDAVVVTDPDPDVEDVLDAGGVLQLHVTPTQAPEIVAQEGDDAFDELGLRFGFGPSLAAHAVLLANLLEQDGCRDTVLVTTDDTDPERDTTALGEVFETALAAAGIGAERVAISPVDPTLEVTDGAEQAADDVAEVLEEEGCAVFAVDEPDGNLAMVLTALDAADLGPHDRFLYGVDTAVSVDLLDIADQLEDGG